MKTLRTALILLTLAFHTTIAASTPIDTITPVPRYLVAVQVSGTVPSGSAISLDFSPYWDVYSGVDGSEVFSFWVAIPDHGIPALIVTAYDEFGDILTPTTCVDIGKPGILRGVRVAPVTISPFVQNGLKLDKIYQIDLKITASDNGENEVVFSRRSKTYDKIIQSLVINPPRQEGLDEFDQEHLLIICPDFATLPITPFVEWKRRKGLECTLSTLSEIGISMYNAEGLRDYIQEAYETWDNPPDFVLLAGDETVLPVLYDWTDDPPTIFSYASVPGNYLDENYFACVDGSDYFPDVILGRWAVNTETEYMYLSAKINRYEMNPNLANTNWYKQAIVAAQDSNYYQGDPSMRLTKLQTRDWMLNYGFTQVDTIFGGDNPYQITLWVNQGRNLINYRGAGWSMGWAGVNYYYDQLPYVFNNNMLPVITGIGCGAAKFDEPDGTCFGELWMLLGEESLYGDHRGSISFVGPGWNTHTDFNNELDLGIYDNLFNDGEERIGAALIAGKMAMYDFFDDYFTIDPNVEEIIRVAFNQYYVLSDPEIKHYSDIPTELSAIVPPAVFMGSQTVDITVTNHLGVPYEGALVCAYLPGDFQAADLTGPNGNVELTTNASTLPSYVYITVTAHNHIPVLDSILVITESQYVLHQSVNIDDAIGGNGDGALSPGESLDWEETLKNFGIIPANGVEARLSSNHPLISITQDYAQYGDIAAGDSAVGIPSYSLLLDAENYIIGDDIDFQLDIEDSADSSWTSIVTMPLLTPALNVLDLSPDPTGNGRFDRGEVCNVTYAIQNNGSIAATDGQVELHCDDPLVNVIMGSASCGYLEINSSFYSGTNPFLVEISPYTPTLHEIELIVLFTSEETTYSFIDSVSLSFTVGDLTQEDPTMEESGLYYAYESFDTLYSETPLFEWFEIDPEAGGPGAVLPFTFDDQIITIMLPFTFTYWGEDYIRISICADGWIVPGVTSSIPADNYDLPNIDDADGMVAGLWDNLWNVNETGTVSTYYDSGNGLFYIEYNEIMHQSGTIPKETFQIVLCDPAVEPTTTGDSEIIIYYKTLHFYGINFSTSGIESPDELNGISYSYNNINPVTAYGLTDSMAIKWTTDPPFIVALEPDIATGKNIPTMFEFNPPYPNPFNPTTTLSFSIPSNGQVELKVFNISGQIVYELMDRRLNPGNYSCQFDASKLGSGIYFARLLYNDLTSVQKLLLIK